MQWGRFHAGRLVTSWLAIASSTSWQTSTSPITLTFRLLRIVLGKSALSLKLCRIHSLWVTKRPQYFRSTKASYLLRTATTPHASISRPSRSSGARSSF
ncbi:hypothetical protein PR003_g11256 [Phytophthora rubi]|uniref:Secreted protein n=1 Tax=Phytophthora rubi TaxID=129364 RepID=A0A6A3MHE9_9STRA|nr:hypothetical protein PR002_g10609 [Phytophthora rubi]KAE9031919.1 hypothetical protein PR001_g10844 [Phytophthora rubi]KAE9338965.1 hypothetical protein PR003_g11256 [Phytophthora rubi]